MGLTVKNKTSYELSDNLTDFFSLPIEEKNEDEYSELKDNIYSLDIDLEEKANIINKINSLKISKNKKEIIKELDNFKRKYNL